MQKSSIPEKFPIPFANNAGSTYIRAVPQASQIGIQNGAASLYDGFPPLTFLTSGAGGSLPFGADFNGLLNQISAWNQWQSAGNPVVYDATFSSEIGGYPQGALLASTTAGQLWLCATDNNTSNPDAAGAGWVPVFTGVAGGRLLNIQTFLTPTVTSYTATTGTASIIVAISGGGGAGGGTPTTSGSQSAAAGGGGTGAFAVCRYTSGFGGILGVTIGSGGAAVAGGNGNAGTASSFGSLITCNGGNGGYAGTAVTTGFTNPGGGGSSPSGSGIIISSPGRIGGNGIVLSAGNVQSGLGANSFFGSGGSNNASGPGSGGAGYGSGGGGAGATTSAGSTYAGGAGSGGFVLVFEFT